MENDYVCKYGKLIFNMIGPYDKMLLLWGGFFLLLLIYLLLLFISFIYIIRFWVMFAQ